MTRAKCVVRRTTIDLCTGLGESLEDSHNAQQTRLTYEVVRKLSTMAVSGVLVVLRSGMHRKNGICFNWCPFCGENLAAARTGLEKEK